MISRTRVVLSYGVSLNHVLLDNPAFDSCDTMSAEAPQYSTQKICTHVQQVMVTATEYMALIRSAHRL